MSVGLLAPAAGGKAYCYHVSLSRGEHFYVAAVRRDSRATYLICPLCDAVTSIPRTDANAAHREVQALIDAGTVTPLVHPETTPLDPLQAGKEDGIITITHDPTVILLTWKPPQDSIGRKGLRATLWRSHIDKRPAGF